MDLDSEKLFIVESPPPTDPPKDAESKFSWISNDREFCAGDEFDRIVFRNDELYDVTQDSFRYGRITSGTSYNLATGKMPEKVLQEVQAKDQEIDDPEIWPEDPRPPGNRSFEELYDGQMPKYFEYRSDFPEIRGIWTLLFDQQHYRQMSTFELQAAICAALNSRHHLILCVGIDAFNTVTGVEMSPVDRVTFRMALSRAVAGEFQPPLVKLAPKLLTGVSPMKRDVSEITSIVDVLFVPVFTAENEENRRFLIVVRVKELTDKFYQLSSGRIYQEKEGRVVEMENLNEAFHSMIARESMSGIQQRRGSLFMLEPEPFIENTPIPMEHEAAKVPILQENRWTPFLDAENIGWMLFATAIGYLVFKNVVKPLVK